MSRAEIVTDPNLLEWTFSEIPAIEDVPPDAWLVVWDLPTGIMGLVHPWGNELNPMKWQHSSFPCCTDGCWFESRGEGRQNADGSVTIRENGVNLVQTRSVRKPVWWAWVCRGTPDKPHPHPTWRQVHGPLPERDWE